MPTPLTNDLAKRVQKIAQDYRALLEANNKEEYDKKKRQIAETAQMAKLEEIQKDSMTQTRPGEEMTHWQISEQKTEEALKQELTSYNNASTAIATLVSLNYLLTKALHHSLKAAIYYPIKHGLKNMFMKDEIAELKQVGDLPPLKHLVDFQDGKLNIQPIKLSEGSKDPQASSLVNAMTQTLADVVRFWLTEEHNCTATADPNVFLDSAGDELTEQSFNGMKNHATKGLQAYLNVQAPGVLFKEMAPADLDAQDRPSASP